MTVDVSNAGDIAIVRINRPDARNAVNPEMADALSQAFVAYERDPQLKVAILTGIPGAFCAGFDLKRAAGGMD